MADAQGGTEQQNSVMRRDKLVCERGTIFQ